MSKEKSIEQIAVEAVERFVNIMSHDNEEFCRLMTREHPTNQQAFTKLCLKWLETVAHSDYATDGRNIASKEVVTKLLKTEDVEVLFGGKPSQYLPLI